MNTSYVQIRNELANEQLIKVQFQVAISGRYSSRAGLINWMFSLQSPLSLLKLTDVSPQEKPSTPSRLQLITLIL